LDALHIHLATIAGIPVCIVGYIELCFPAGHLPFRQVLKKQFVLFRFDAAVLGNAWEDWCGRSTTLDEQRAELIERWHNRTLTSAFSGSFDDSSLQKRNARLVNYVTPRLQPRI
jgi:hypothetical protein